VQKSTLQVAVMKTSWKKEKNQSAALKTMYIRQFDLCMRKNEGLFIFHKKKQWKICEGNKLRVIEISWGSQKEWHEKTKVKPNPLCFPSFSVFTLHPLYVFWEWKFYFFQVDIRLSKLLRSQKLYLSVSLFLLICTLIHTPHQNYNIVHDELILMGRW